MAIPVSHADKSDFSMVWPKFADVPCDVWRYPHRLGKGADALCLYHASTDLGREILVASAELQGEAPPGRRVLTLSPHRANACRKLTLQYVHPRTELQVMYARVSDGEASIELTPLGLALLSEALAKWLQGGEDFGISPRQSGLPQSTLGDLDRESAEVWFWGPQYWAP